VTGELSAEAYNQPITGTRKERRKSYESVRRYAATNSASATPETSFSLPSGSMIGKAAA